jgi:hypothetical protein
MQNRISALYETHIIDKIAGTNKKVRPFAWHYWRISFILSTIADYLLDFVKKIFIIRLVPADGMVLSAD